ncbi:MAG: prepilin-type N-terminal cleavage/methylation domain-containing protein [Gammaproteobacteria bacterium]|nr:prepilin-type N-terminal cleavage/methylation domain-containing protein [Gammaproteobacteria bacterium]
MMRRSRGFTLIELVVSLVIMAIASGVVMPYFAKSMESIRQKNCAREIATMLRKSASDALSEHRKIEVLFETEGRTVKVNDKKVKIAWPASSEIMESGAHGIGGEKSILLTFYPDGTSSGGAFDIVSEKRGFRIEINWITSHVAVSSIRA